MNRISGLLVAGGGRRPGAGYPGQRQLEGFRNNAKGLLERMAEKMPEESYAFKPTPEMQSFGQRLGHAIAFHMRGRAQAKGEQKAVAIAPTSSKADLFAAMKEANDECDSVFSSLTDAEGVKRIPGGRGGPRTRFAVWREPCWSTLKRCTVISRSTRA